MPISLKTRKFVRSLQLKKHRKEEQCFVVEGAKGVLELMSSNFEIVMILGTGEFRRENEEKLRGLSSSVEEATEADLIAAGSLQTNNGAIAVARMKPNAAPKLGPEDYALVLDDIRDPGNVGTIIRTADWYGIRCVIASEETADFYNSKSISASMGSFTRISVYYTNLANYLHESPLMKYGAFLDGTNVHNLVFASGGLIVIGNESRGISGDVASFIDQKITIPRFGEAESLNAALSTAIILDNLKRS